MTDPAPAVSVIVPAYAVADLVGEALRSLQAQTFTDWEAIVVDDGTPDDVTGALRPFADDPRIRLLRTDNRGVAMARNRAIGIARAPLIALLDGDDLYEPQYLALMMAAIERDETIGFVTCDAVFFGDRARAGQLFSGYNPQKPPVTLEAVLRREFNVFTASLMRREAFAAVDGYDTTLRSAEDFDLWLRMLEAGWQCAYVPQPLARYRRRPTSLSRQTLAMTRALARVYRSSAARLAGRPEAAVATRMARRIEQESGWTEGEALVREGHVREGLRLLRLTGAWRRSPRWMVAMPLMLAFPALAGPILRKRQHWNDVD